VDKIVEKTYAKKFTIIDVSGEHITVPSPAVPPRTHLPRSESGQLLRGSVLAAYVVTTGGRAIDPVVIKSTDKRLDSTVLNMIKELRFDPFKRHGSAISILASQEFIFSGKDTHPQKPI
jgi:hypothetical protein